MATVRKLIVEIVDARSLLPKDGQGTSSPYVVVDFYGQRKRTQTVMRDLNPTWNEVLEFNVGAHSDVFGDMLELDVYHDRNIGPTRRNNFLGRIRLCSYKFVRKGEEALMYFPLEKKSFFSWIQGEIGLKIYYADEPVPPPSPPPPPAIEEKSDTPVGKQPGSDQQTTEEAASGIKPDKPAESSPESDKKESSVAAEDAAKSDTPAAPSAEANPSPPPEGQAEPPPEVSKPEEPVEPPQEASKSEEPAATPSAEAAPVAEPAPQAPPEGKPPESDPPPPEAAALPVDPPSSQPVQLHTENIEATHKWIPPPEVMAATRSGSMPEVRFSGYNDGRPISRQSTSDNFLRDPMERVPNERSSYDLVEKMHYLFVRVVKSRSLPTKGYPVVKISVSGSHVRTKPARKTSFFEWDQTFAFGQDEQESVSTMEVSVWDPPSDSVSDVAGTAFLGGICFDVSEIPLRDPPDSPLAPQWYRLEGGGAHYGDLMLATWIGTQADEAFSDAWKTDTFGNVSSRSKVYISPKLWYLRATVIEAQDILPLTALRESSFQVKAKLGFQVLKTKASVSRSGSPLWNEDLIFVAAEPFGDHLVFSIENRPTKGMAISGVARIPLATIERRVDDRKVVSRWFSLEASEEEKKAYKGRIHLRLCFDGGYHVMDEPAHACSDFRPTARQLWKPPVGIVELGIVGCKNLLPMKMVNGKGTTDAYSVAKYGQKWVRTRTVLNSLDPKWNEQYTWKVYDPCTVLSLGVFDSWGVYDLNGSKGTTRPDFRMGKIRIRISTLEIGRVYRNTYPLLLLSPSGVKKMGDIELAIRFVRSAPTLDLLHVYAQPMLPLMHHIKPLAVVQQELLRSTASKIVATYLSQSEPPLMREVVLYMLDADSHAFSMRKVRANWFRIINVIAGVIDVVRWIDDTRSWKNPTATLLVHALLVMLVWFPDLIIPTLAFYLFVIGAWNYRFRLRDLLPHLDSKISQADAVDRDELDEEFDTVPSSRSTEIVGARYDKLRMLGARVQTLLGDFATQGERVQALVTWRDPRATGIFVGLCFMVAVIMYLVPSKVVAMAFGFYYLRHPMFRDRIPSPALSFFRRLPSLQDQMM